MKHLALIILLFGLIYPSYAQDQPSEESIAKDYSIVFNALDGRQGKLDTSIYHFEKIKPLYLNENESFMEEETEAIDWETSDLTFNIFSGHFSDFNGPQCIALAWPEGLLINSDKVWSTPFAVMFFYRYENQQWKVVYATAFYNELWAEPLNVKNKKDVLWMRKTNCTDDSGCVTIEGIYEFRNNRLNKLYYNESTTNESQARALYKTDPVKYSAKYKPGDSLGITRSIARFSDYDNDGVNELFVYEDRIVAAKPNNDGFVRKRYSVIYTYKYRNNKFEVVEKTEPVMDEGSGDF